MKYIKVKTALNVDKEEAVRFKKFAKDLENFLRNTELLLKVLVV